jgi:hydroxyacylglutathione hydrolase
MRVRIHAISLGAQCYVIQGEGTVVVDSGTPNQANGFMKALDRLPMRPEETQLMVITHGHWDHIGSAKELKEITGAKIALHQREKDRLENSLKLLPPGVTRWGRIIMGLTAMQLHLVDIPATDVDLVLGDEQLSLAEYGIPGRVIHTPGHTMGSVSVLLETGDALVGDLAMNGFPLRLGPGLPTAAEDMQRVKESWNLLLEQGAETVYPGHGKPFSAALRVPRCSRDGGGSWRFVRHRRRRAPGDGGASKGKGGGRRPAYRRSLARSSPAAALRSRLLPRSSSTPARSAGSVAATAASLSPAT